MNSIISIDTEYTNFDVSKGDVIQIGLVVAQAGIVVGELEQNIRPYKLSGWTKGAEQVHGISQDKAMFFPSKEEAVLNILTFMRQFDFVMTPLGFNPRNDLHYINSILGHHVDWSARLRLKCIDVLEMVRDRKQTFGDKSKTLGAIAKKLGLEHNSHNALSDAKVTYEIYQLLSGIKKDFSASQEDIDYAKSELEKRKKFIDRGYVQVGERGDVYITEKCTSNKIAMQTVIDELTEIFDVY